MKLTAFSIIVAIGLAGCGGSGGGTAGTPVPATTTTKAANGSTGTLPPGATSPAATNTAAESTDTAEQAAEGPAATEASPEAAAEGPAASGELPDSDRTAVTAVVSGYVEALDHHRAARVCALLAPGSLDVHELPRDRGGCRPSLRASIGVAPRAGGPAWRRTAVVEMKVERLSDDRARVSATVTHHFTDRRYVSVEDDVIYLERVGGRWLLAKPSGTLYRAVGYRSPPLRAFSPPADW